MSTKIPLCPHSNLNFGAKYNKIVSLRHCRRYSGFAFAFVRLKSNIKRNHRKTSKPRGAMATRGFFVQSGRIGRTGTENTSEKEGMSRMKKVAIVMGSDSDLPVLQGGMDMLRKLEIPMEVHVMSAHRTPAAACDFSSHAEANGFGVIIAAAGKAAHLAGVLAAHTTLPVIGVPVKSSTLDGLDALLSTVQMPKGIPVATVAIDGSDNAAILAAQILALGEETLAAKLRQMKADMEAEVLKKDAALQEKLNG